MLEQRVEMMKKNSLVLLLCSFILLSGCTQTAGNEVEIEAENRKLIEELIEKEIQLEELNQNVEKLNDQIEILKEEKEKFTIISNLSKDFVKAHTTGDQERLRELLAADLTLEQKENKLYIQVRDYDWFLFDYNAEGSFDDYVIQGYEFNGETNTYRVFIREFYSDVKGNSVSPPTFLNLVFEFQEDEWKVISLEFDV